MLAPRNLSQNFLRKIVVFDKRRKKINELNNTKIPFTNFFIYKFFNPFYSKSIPKCHLRKVRKEFFFSLRFFFQLLKFFFLHFNLENCCDILQLFNLKFYINSIKIESKRNKKLKKRIWEAQEKKRRREKNNN